MSRAHRLAPAADFAAEKAAPIVAYVGTAASRRNATVGSSSTSAVEIPPGARVVELRLTDSVYFRWGGTEVGAAAADTNSMLIVGGEKLMVVPSGVTHFRAIRVGSADVALQMEEVEVK